MFPWAREKAGGVSPSENFVTTYQRDYKPMEDRQPRLKARTEARPAPGLSSLSQAERETWPMLVQHFYRTVNSSNGSGAGPQHPSGTAFPAFLPSLGTLTPSFSEAAGGVGFTLKEAAAAQEARAAMETRLSFDASSAGNVLKQLESKDGVQYQEGVILLAPCTDDVESWQSCWSGWSPVVDLQLSRCGRKPERPGGGSGSLEKPVVPAGRKHQYRTEYGDKFTAEVKTEPSAEPPPASPGLSTHHVFVSLLSGLSLDVGRFTSLPAAGTAVHQAEKLPPSEINTQLRKPKLFLFSPQCQIRTSLSGGTNSSKNNMAVKAGLSSAVSLGVITETDSHEEMGFKLV
ncbi:uncharacterized protein LOC112450935 isoform X3 [Kryptolebias marmoratus]|uniref:uncharacterized protein LOC112450935 isoform X3 n=1 Tax=Kryptolebias marmoratus TaxID=37003 RepID=UPI000D530790|nr:uncharacterized protein LOC112450935 isoform X3 [Kryptolebias marmoratus]